MKELNLKTIEYFFRNEHAIKQLLLPRTATGALNQGYRSYRCDDVLFSNLDFQEYLLNKDIYLSPLYSAMSEEN